MYAVLLFVVVVIFLFPFFSMRCVNLLFNMQGTLADDSLIFFYFSIKIGFDISNKVS